MFICMIITAMTKSGVFRKYIEAIGTTSQGKFPENGQFIYGKKRILSYYFILILFLDPKSLQ